MDSRKLGLHRGTLLSIKKGNISAVGEKKYANKKEQYYIYFMKLACRNEILVTAFYINGHGGVYKGDIYIYGGS